jgi:hypothetical protein
MTFDCLQSLGRFEGQLILIEAAQSYTVNVNNGLRAATGDILIVGNNDLIFTERWLDGLLIILKDYDIATCWTSDQDVKLEAKVEDNAKFGSLFAMKRKVYETIGGFDEQFKGYFADLDYRERALKMGFSIGKNLNLVVQHKAKSTYAVTDPKDQEYLRSMRLFEAKYGYIL